MDCTTTRGMGVGRVLECTTNRGMGMGRVLDRTTTRGMGVGRVLDCTTNRGMGMGRVLDCTVEVVDCTAHGVAPSTLPPSRLLQPLVPCHLVGYYSP